MFLPMQREFAGIGVAGPEQDERHGTGPQRRWLNADKYSPAGAATSWSIEYEWKHRVGNGPKR